MKNITILFFGKLKESWSESQFNWQTSAEDIGMLYAEILKHAKDIPYKASIKAAVNDEFVDWNHVIKDGDTIAFLPPASGG